MLLSAVFFLIHISCELVSDNGDSVQGVKALRLTKDDISGWTEVSSKGFEEFEAASLHLIINGDAPQYVDKGLVKGFIQHINNAEKRGDLFILDFGTESNAAAMYNYMNDQNNYKAKAGNYDMNTAQLNTSAADGVTAYSHFGRYYIEIRLKDFPNVLESHQTAESLIEVFQYKISDL